MIPSRFLNENIYSYDSVGSYYEQTGSTITKYYYADAQRVAMRVNGTLSFLLTDHLGSTSVTTNANGNRVSEMRYTAWGEVRYTSGTTLTHYTFTGQYSNMTDFGLMFYNARWYDPALGRFAQADSLVPPGVQGYDRYAYVNNNPVRYTDPTGHDPWWDDPDFNYANNSSIMSVPVVYIIAGIKVQSEFGYTTKRGADQYASLGPAKVTDAQMNTAYGDPVMDSTGAIRGYGLGMAGQDQLRWGVAFEAMGRRIQLVTDACNRCGTTDLFIAASQAQNGPGFTQKNMQTLSAPQNRIQPSSTLNWPGWFGAKPWDLRFWWGTRHQLDAFSDYVKELKNEGWYAPDVNWDSIKNLK